MSQKKSLEDDSVPNLGDTFFSRLEEFGSHLPSLGETKSPCKNSAPEHKYSDKLVNNGNPAAEHEKIRDCNKDPLGLSHDKLVIEQENHPTLSKLGQRALPQQEAKQIPVCFYKQNGVLMRKWRPPDAPVDEEWTVVHQIIVPKVYL